jgi:putative DNA methylase
MNYRKKLIEVALPLEAINKESAREKSIRHGHPSTLHLWWARRPLAACRAVLFASLVDDPSSHPDKFPTEEAQEKERKRLFQIIENLVKWDNVNNQQVLDAAKTEILKSTDNNPPPVYDPFCGGGSIPLEAQRLGLEAHGSDLNPVAVLITKALIEIPPKFKDRPPVNPEAQQKLIPPAPLHKGGAAGGGIWYGAQGLAEDVRYYGKWMRDKAEKRIGHLYPKVKLPTEYGGGEATAIAWLWARTVQCPNPACGAKMPLVRSFALSTKKGKEAWVEPAINRDSVPHIVSFEVKTGKGKAPDGTVSRKGAVCICCGKPVAFDYIRSEGKAGRMSAQLMAIVAEGNRSRLYLASTEEHIEIADSAQPEWKPDTDLPEQALGFRGQGYGMTKHADLFTSRQLVALTTFSDLVSEAREKIILNAVAAGMPDDSLPLCEGGTGATGYADAVATYLAFVISKIAEASSTICTWSSSPKNELVVSTFRRQAIPMTWDFAEANIFGISSGSVVNIMQFIAKVVIDFPDLKKGIVKQSDATAVMIGAASSLISTDPPYYDNIVSADFSDFLYVWLGRSLDKRFPNVISTLLTPKAQELVATPYRFGGNKQKAKEFFEEGLGKAFARMRETANPEYPLTVYYAFKQTETEDDEDENQVNSAIASTGWETMLEGLIKAGFSINGTWPMRTERGSRTIASGTNALASSIVLVCRPRPETAPSATRRQFLNELKRELPDALHTLQQGNIAPVDLAQASIGPGMAIYSRYSQVLEADGTPMRVRTALQLINQTLDEYLSEQEGEFDADTRWALTWFEQNQYKEGLYGDAETLSKAKNTSVSGLVTGGILTAKGGKVRLLRRDELPENWNPATDNRTSDWEATQYLIRTLDQKGESGTAALLAQLGNRGEVARDLAYRLYNICDRKGWTSEAIGYNSLVISWSEIIRLAVEQQQQPVQMTLDF